jgi:hypothetical protein
VTLMSPAGILLALVAMTSVSVQNVGGYIGKWKHDTSKLLLIFKKKLRFITEPCTFREELNITEYYYRKTAQCV